MDHFLPQTLRTWCQIEMIYNLMYDIPHYLVPSKQFPNIVYESVMEVKYRIES